MDVPFFASQLLFKVMFFIGYFFVFLIFSDRNPKKFILGQSPGGDSCRKIVILAGTLFAGGRCSAADLGRADN